MPNYDKNQVLEIILHITNLYPTKTMQIQALCSVHLYSSILSHDISHRVIYLLSVVFIFISSDLAQEGHSAGDFRWGIWDTASVPHSSSQMSCIAASMQCISQLGHSQPSSLSRPVSWFLVARIIAPFCGVLCQETFCICLAIHTEDVKDCSSSDTNC